MLTMPDNSYWALGERVGTAWDIGKGATQEVAPPDHGAYGTGRLLTCP